MGTEPLRAYSYQGYTITFRESKWHVLDGSDIMYTNKDESEARKWASNHKK